MDIDDIMADVRDTFGALDEPRFGALIRRLQDGPDTDLITALSTRFDVVDRTDLNAAHSWHLLLATGGRQWALRISAVGRYAAFARISQGWDAVLTADTTDLTPDEEGVIGMLTERRLILLGRDDLETPVPLALDGVEDVRAYHALFTEVEILPWDHVTLRRLGLVD